MAQAWIWIQDSDGMAVARLSGRLRRESERLGLVPLTGQIVPLRIHGFDERDPLRPRPRFDLLLAFDRIAHIAKALEIHQPRDVVSRGKSWAEFSAYVL